MANIKISQLPGATSPVSQSDVVPVVQGGVTKKAAIDQLGFVAAGANAVTRTIQNKLRDVVSIKDFGAVGDGTTDDTTAIQNAVTYAVSSGQKYVYAPPGAYRITSTITVGAVSITGAGQDATIFVAAITDGTPVFKCTNITQAHFEKFRITAVTSAYGGTFNPTSFRDGLINGQNCIGIEIDSSGGSYARDFTLRDLFMYGLKTGYKIDAFIGLLENCKAWWCETGLIGTLLNTVELNLLFEGNRKYFDISNSSGVLFRKCMFEGSSTLQSGSASSTIDQGYGIVFDTLYLEEARNTPFIVVGGTTLVQNVTVSGTVALLNAENNLYDLDIAPIVFDRVDGLRFDAYTTTGFTRSTYQTTANTKNIFNFGLPNGGIYSVFDNSNNLTSVKNHFPNPNFDLWLRGWPNITLTDASVSKETSIVRSGNNALKMTKTVGTTGFSYVIFRFNDGYMASVLAGKTVTLYAWVYIPNIAAYNPNFNSGGTALRTSRPYIAIGTNGTGGTVTNSMVQGGRRGGWNLQRISITVPSDATEINVYLVIDTQTTAATNEYLIVDSIYLVEGAYSNTNKIENGLVTDSELIQTSGLVGRMVMRSDSSPTDPDQTFVIGDQVLRLTPTAGGDIGWVCTTDGAGGTAVFKTFATIAA